MIELIMSDLRRCLFIERRNSSSIIWKLYIVVFSYGFHATLVYRIGRALSKRAVTFTGFPLYLITFIIYKVLSFLVRKLYGIEIDPESEIGQGFYVGHFGGIYVGPDCIIGNNCSIHQQVSLGSGDKSVRKKTTTIGNNVWIGAHSKVINGIKIADNATVLVGSHIKTDVQEGVLVMGNPARVINSSYDNSHLMGFGENLNVR